MLELYNPDEYAVEALGASEWQDFWEVAQDFCAEEMFYGSLYQMQFDEIDDLIADKKRLKFQRDKMVELVPKTAEKTNAEYLAAVDKIERKIKSIAGKNVRYTKIIDV